MVYTTLPLGFNWISWEKMGVFLVYRLYYFGCNGVLLNPSPTLKSRPQSVSKSFRLTFCCWRNSAILLNPGRSRGSSLQQLLISCCSYKKCEKSDQQWWNHGEQYQENDKSRNIALIYRSQLKCLIGFETREPCKVTFLRSSLVCFIFRKRLSFLLFFLAIWFYC